MKSHFYTLGQDTLIVQEHKSPADGEIRYAWIIKGWFMNYLDSRWAEPRGRKTFTSFTAALLAGIHFLNYLRAYNPTRCHAPIGGSTTNPQGEIAQCLTD